MATKRFHSLEAKFARIPGLKVHYSKTIHDLIADGHVEMGFQTRLQHCRIRRLLPPTPPGPEGEFHNKRRCYKHSYKVAVLASTLKADIKQMYLCISPHPSHCNFQRILWRDNPQQQLKVLRLKKVTFGVASSPYLAIKTLQTLAEDQKQKYPLAAEVFKRDFYVDDCLSGSNSLEDAICLQQQLIAIMSEANVLQKWSLCSTALLNSVPEEMRESTAPLTFNHDRWNIFIRNIVISIQTTTPTLRWKHVPGVLNQAVILVQELPHYSSSMPSNFRKRFRAPGLERSRSTDGCHYLLREETLQVHLPTPVHGLLLRESQGRRLHSLHGE
ncbi:unnamed protein product [Allacma fusca]|uniref:Reverse transcriptase domain-containing protein n=1 Tax=Allacma fusca TaxID=39272 RepID=A0A8J2PL07_9HEXA|nr:unnamed protein product [Allacma fusca]